ncbi:MAG: aminoglycoside phosphotransferase family protein [Candidatus Thiothrix putei]|uniref:Phosphotransferase enzyme family protein n=2 Tax=Thiothrix TaxID=1030 RepID=A0A1H3W7I7_9GAMM|nr:aminoglycoside phosphotransferase family protein [Thiothrix caldifontis]WGZ95125.1 MAG: aminoglycoside phosphotransferase family protein [Candidatus Thiothrix putei]SDZ83063.1 Phosphotransferase enzyme family protein [Thiothrix caldifontis]
MSDFPTHFGMYIAGHDETPVQYWSDATIPLNGRPPTNQPSSSPARVRSWQSRPYFCDTLARLCEDNLGGVVVQIEFLGGEERSACRVIWESGRVAIASFRTEHGCARLEAQVLHHLHPQAAPVPELFYFNGIVLVQESLQGDSLSHRLATADRPTCETLLSAALSSLVAIHQAAERAGLDQAVPLLGAEQYWIQRHIRQVHKMGEALKIPAPPLSTQDIHDILLPLKPRFVKWDARPGNAMVNTAGQVYWFDWENCGARNRLDDLVWLLCDESVPFCAETEQALLAEYLPQFADGASLEAAYRYACIAGVLHCAARLGLILYKKEGDEWWDMQEILAHDYIGVTLPQAQRLCYRAADWAQRESLVAALTPWFMQVAKHLETL